MQAYKHKREGEEPGSTRKEGQREDEEFGPGRYVNLSKSLNMPYNYRSCGSRRESSHEAHHAALEQSH